MKSAVLEKPSPVALDEESIRRLRRSAAALGWRAILALRPRCVLALYHLAQTDARQGKPLEAIRLLQRVLLQDPDHPRTHLNLARLLLEGGWSARRCRELFDRTLPPKTRSPVWLVFLHQRTALVTITEPLLAVLCRLASGESAEGLTRGVAEEESKLIRTAIERLVEAGILVRSPCIGGSLDDAFVSDPPPRAEEIPDGKAIERRAQTAVCAG